MRYFLYIELDEFYLRTLGLEGEIAVVSQDDRLINVSHRAAEMRVTKQMSLREAKLILLEKAIYIEYREDDYRQAADDWMSLLLLYSGTIEPVSPSAALIDLSAHPDPNEIAATLLSQLHRQTKMPISAGASTAAWIARLSAQSCESHPLDLGMLPVEPVLKPNSWLAEKEISHLTPLPAEVRNRLTQLGIRRVGDLQQMPAAVLSQQFPKVSSFIQAAASGRLSDPVKPLWPAESYSCTQPLESCGSELEIDSALRELAQKASLHLCSNDQSAGSLRLYVSLESHEVRQIERSLKSPFQAASQIHTHLRQLYQQMQIAEEVAQVRLLMRDLQKAPRRQTTLGFSQERDTVLLNTTVKRIRMSHGQLAVVLGSQIKYSREKLVFKAWSQAYGWK